MRSFQDEVLHQGARVFPFALYSSQSEDHPNPSSSVIKMEAFFRNSGGEDSTTTEAVVEFFRPQVNTTTTEATVTAQESSTEAISMTSMVNPLYESFGSHPSFSEISLASDVSKFRQFLLPN